jgi:hypothetical protein
MAFYLFSHLIGRVDRLLDLCHARGLPLLTAICLNQDRLSDCELDLTHSRVLVKVLDDQDFSSRTIVLSIISAAMNAGSGDANRAREPQDEPARADRRDRSVLHRVTTRSGIFPDYAAQALARLPQREPQ